jgi:hypothetical protein
MGSWAGAGPGLLGGISGGTLGDGTSGGVLGGDGAGDGLGCGPGGCWLIPTPRGFVCCMHNLVHRLNRPASRVVPRAPPPAVAKHQLGSLSDGPFRRFNRFCYAPRLETESFS